MKKILVLLLGILFANFMRSQTTLETLTKDCVFKLQENYEMETFEYADSAGKKVSHSIYEVAALLRKDVVRYYNMQEKYDTELKVSMYKKTEEYRSLYQSFMKEYDHLTKGKGYLLYTLRYNNPYDVAKRCFNIKIGFDDVYRYSQPGYLCIPNGLALTYPSAYLSRTSKRSNLAMNGIYNYNILKTTTIPEETALKIEQTLRDPYCSTRLLIIFKLTTTATEKKEVGGYLIPQNFIIGKTLAAYLVDEKTGEVYADMSHIFSQTTNKSVASPRKR